MVAQKPYIPRQGDVMWLNFSPQMGSKEQAGRRPALVVSATTYNKTGLMLACPITSKVKGYPFEVSVNAGKIKGAILADHLKIQDWRERKCEYIAKAPTKTVIQVQDLIAALLLG